jgi:hypothetical protein
MLISIVFTQYNMRSQCLDGDWTTNDATCESSSDGSICCDTLYSLIPGAGLPPYTCVISPNAGSYNSATSCFINLPAGTYQVTTTSSDGCSVTFYSLVVGLTYQPITATFVYSPATCGTSNGGICANVTGGSGSYSYSWTGPPLYNTVLSNTNCISNQSIGTYQLIIDDNNSPCTAAYSRTIQNSVLNLSGGVLNTTCVAPNCNGSIDLTISGTAPYNISWSGPSGFSSNTEDLSGLCPGNYAVTVIDANNCTGTATFTVGLEGADVVTGGTSTAANVITANTTWNPAYFGGQTTVIVDADVVVNAGVSLTINNLIVLVTPGHCIRANNLSSIMTNNSTFDVICGDTWHGFEILGGGSTAAITNRGYLGMNNCITRHAECGIRNYQPSNYPYPYSGPTNNGGNIEASSSSFEDNIFDLDIRLFTSNNDNNRSAKFENCDFVLNNLPARSYTFGFIGPSNTPPFDTYPRLLDGPMQTSFLVTHQRILCTGVNRTLFLDCRLLNQNANYANFFGSCGLRITNASITWEGTWPGDNFNTSSYSSEITGWRRGVTATGFTAISGANNPIFNRINFNNTLFQCHQGISGLGSFGLDARNNVFTWYPNAGFNHLAALGGTLAQFYGIRFNNSSQTNLNINPQEYIIAHNAFVPPTFPNVNFTSKGVHAYDCGSLNNYIIDNTFINCQIGILAELSNRSVAGNTGMRYECNTFINTASLSQQVRDISIIGNASASGNNFAKLGVHNLQQRSFEPAIGTFSAGNKFIQSIHSLTLDDIRTDGGNPLIPTPPAIPPHTYFVHPLTEVNAANQAIVNGDLTLPEMTSNAHTPFFDLVQPNQCGYTWQPPNQPNIQNLVNLRTSKSLLESTLQSIVDGGDTDAMLFEIDGATYQNALTLFEELMMASPSLSQDVLIAAIQKEFELPKPLLALVLQSNPEAAKDPKIHQAISERNDPLTEYQHTQFLSGKYWLSNKEILTQQIAATDAQIEKEIFNLIILGFDSNSLMATLDENNPNEAKLKAEILASSGQIQESIGMTAHQLTLQKIDDVVSTSETYATLLEIRHQTLSNGIHQLSPSNLDKLLAIWNNNTGGFGDLAYLYLVIFAGYPELDIPEAHEQRSLEVAAEVQPPLVIKNNLRIWPNPASEFIQIQIENPNLEPCEIMILDGFGKEVLRSKLDVLQTEVLVDIKEIPIGRYFVKIIGGIPFETSSFLKN